MIWVWSSEINVRASPLFVIIDCFKCCSLHVSYVTFFLFLHVMFWRHLCFLYANHFSIGKHRYCSSKILNFIYSNRIQAYYTVLVQNTHECILWNNCISDFISVGWTEWLQWVHISADFFMSILRIENFIINTLKMRVVAKKMFRYVNFNWKYIQNL